MSDSYIVKTNDLECLPRERAVLWVSVGGGRDFDGQRFHDVVCWARDHFEEVWVDVADTDKAINYQAYEGLSDEKARQYARAMGDLWLVQNSDALEKIPKGRILRYDHWVDREKYPIYKNKIERLFASNERFKKVLLQEAEAYVLKKMNRLAPEYVDASTKYILGEIAAVCVRAEELRAVCLYPGSQKEPFRLIRERVFEEAPIEMSFELYAPLTVRRRCKQSVTTAINT